MSMLSFEIKTQGKICRSKRKGGVSMINEDCRSCKEISELLVNSSTVLFAKETGRRIMCRNNHIVYNGLEQV